MISMKHTILLTTILLASKINAQNVGIGTLTPTESKLVVVNNTSNLLTIRNETTGAPGVTAGLAFMSGTQYTGAIRTINTQSNYARLGFFTYANSISTNLRERLSITDSGFVGINNTNPQTLLQITGNSDFPADKRRVVVTNAKTVLSGIINDNALEVNGDARFDQSYIHLNNSRLGIGAVPAYDLDIINSSIRIADGTQATGKILTSDNLGVATWQDPAGAKAINATFASDQTIPTNTSTKVKFVTNVGDGFNDFSLSNYNNTTNSFIAPADGNYLVHAKIRYSSSNSIPDNYIFGISIKRTSPIFSTLSDTYRDMKTIPSSTGFENPFLEITKVVKLTAGDAISIYTDHTVPNATSTLNLINPIGDYAHFNVVKL